MGLSLAGKAPFLPRPPLAKHLFQWRTKKHRDGTDADRIRAALLTDPKTSDQNKRPAEEYGTRYDTYPRFWLGN